MKNFFAAFSNFFTGGSKPIQTNITTGNYTNYDYKPNLHKTNTENPSNTTSNKIKRIFDVEIIETNRNQNSNKIHYNESVYFNPKSKGNPNNNNIDNHNDEMSKVISNVIKNQKQNVRIEKEGNNIYKVNLNINNNYYGSNFNINYGDKQVQHPHSSQQINPQLGEIGVGQIKSIPCRGGVVQEINTRNSKTSELSRTSSNNMIKKKSKDNSNNQITVPCLNCGNLIDMDDIENHSENCLIVKEETRESIYENHELNEFNFKLMKLDECICKHKNKENKDGHYYVSLSEYINSASRKILIYTLIYLFLYIYNN